MRRRLAILLTGSALIAGFPAAAVNTAAAGPAAHATCVSATIGGRHKCIARGQYCARSHQADYRRYGYSCSRRDRNGRYHLT